MLLFLSQPVISVNIGTDTKVIVGYYDGILY